LRFNAAYGIIPAIWRLDKLLQYGLRAGRQSAHLPLELSLELSEECLGRHPGVDFANVLRLCRSEKRARVWCEIGNLSGNRSLTP